MTNRLMALLSSHDYDVRKTRDARFMDQKCTPDVVSIIADCVINLIGNDVSLNFTVRDIWDSQYFRINVRSIFNKPDATNQTAQREYDKFIQQPLRLLAYSGVLSVKKQGINNIYRLKEPEVLEYISIRDRNAFNFLYHYLMKVMADSHILRYFEVFKESYINGTLSNEDLSYLRERFDRFIRGNTGIRGSLEVNRIFNKILNIFSTYEHLPGSVLGRLTNSEYTFGDLMYNRRNWRDIGKVKNLSRQESVAIVKNNQTDQAYDNYLVQKAISTIKRLYTESEVRDQWAIGEATQVHHIFPRSKFPQLASYLENLIKLTPTQHNVKAHPSNKTTEVNRDYQLTCLLAKCDSVETSLKKGEAYYNWGLMVEVVNVGLTQTIESTIEYRDLKVFLAHLYNN